MGLAQGHKAVPLVRLKPVTSRSRVKHSAPEPLHSLLGTKKLNTCMTTSKAKKTILLNYPNIKTREILTIKIKQTKQIAHFTTLCLLMSSADNLCNQFGPRQAR